MRLVELRPYHAMAVAPQTSTFRWQRIRCYATIFIPHVGLRMHGLLFVLPFLLSCMLATGGAFVQDDVEFAVRWAELKKLQKLSNPELLEKFSGTQVGKDDWSDHEKISVEMLLTEMVRRGGTVFEQAILEKMRLQKDAISEWKKKEAELDKKREKGLEVKPIEGNSPSEENLPMLIALRRLQKMPEPVEIAVKPLDVASTTNELPEFAVELKNVDVEKHPFHFTFGGDYRSGREARWAFEVRNAKGNLVPPRRWEAMIGGGMFQTGDLPFGKTWTTTLPLGNYVVITDPGEYTARVYYHNTETITSFPPTPGLMLCSSKPFKFSIGKPVPRKVFIQAGSVEKTKSLVAALKGKTKIKTVYGKYDEKLHKFIEPTSPEGQLLLMGWSAVPGYLEILKDENITKEQRAWIFAQLDTVAQVDDWSPNQKRWNGVLGDFESRFPGGYSNGNGDIDVQLQKQFAKEYLTLAPELWEFVVDDAGFQAARLLDGAWILVKGTNDGNPLLEKDRDVVWLNFKQGQIVWRHHANDDTSILGYKATVTKAKFQIVATSYPQAIDFEITQGVDAGKKRLGIFKIDGDQLTLCLAVPGQKRPTDFTVTAGNQHSISLWKRNP